jgi:hypothetical protein
MTVLLVIDAVITAILVPLALNERQVAHDATSFGVLFTTAKVRDAVDAVNGLAGFHFLVFLTIAVLWMIWMWRAANNTTLLRRFKPRFASGFAIGGWFIPIAFWVIPGMHMYDIDKGSGPPLPPGERPRGSGRHVVWWVHFVAGGGGSGVGQVTLKRGHRYDASSFDVRNTVFVLAMLAMVAAAILAVLVVRSITRAQHAAWDATSAGASSSGPFAPAPAPAPWSPGPPPAPAVPQDTPPAAPPVAPAPGPDAPGSDAPGSGTSPPTWPAPPPSDP